MQVREVVVSFEHGVNQSCKVSRQISFDPAGQGSDPVEDLLSASPLLGEHSDVLACPFDVNVDLVVDI